MKTNLIRMWLMSGLLVVGTALKSVHGQVNSWANTASGTWAWQDGGNWSLSVPPSSSQIVLITNAVSAASGPRVRAVTIDSTTSGSSPSTMTVNNLTISAPSGSTNTLHLTNAGTFTALHVLNSIFVSNNASMLVSNSLLRVDCLNSNNMAIDGAVTLNTGAIVSTNNASVAGLIVGYLGQGSLSILDGTMTANLVGVGFRAGSRGVLTIAGGTNTFLPPPGFFSLLLGGAAGSTGETWVTGGRLDDSASGFGIGIGSPGAGQMTVSNGTVACRSMFLGSAPGGRGTLTVAGGTSSIFSNLNLGNIPCTSTGIVTVVGGSLYVTNATGNSELTVRTGTLTLNAGTLHVDKFVMTNFCGFFARTGGTLIYGSAVLNPNRDDDGDGIPNGYEQSYGLDPLNPIDAALDSDGDGQTNLQEFQAGTDPTNGASAFRTTEITEEVNGIRVTWMMGLGKTNALERTAGVASGSYDTNSFVPIFIVTNTSGTVTNYLDTGAATNSPTRYYRIRLIP